MRDCDFPQNIIDEIGLTTPLPKTFTATLRYLLTEVDIQCETTLNGGKGGKNYGSIFWDYYVTDASLADLGEKYGLSAERIRQINIRVSRFLRRSHNKACLQMGLREYFLDQLKNEVASIKAEFNEEISELRNEMYDKGYKDCANGLAPKPSQNTLDTREWHLAKDIEELGLSVRAYHGLRRAGCKTVADIINLKPEGLWWTRTLGKVCYDEIVGILIRDYGEKREDWYDEDGTPLGQKRNPPRISKPDFREER